MSKQIQKTHFCSECERLAKENERLREALEKYGDHKYECSIRTYPDNPCTCGFDSVLTGQPESEAGDETTN